jgi:hypothetical protein
MKHSTEFDGTETTFNVQIYLSRIVRETTEITKYPHNFNCEEGYKLTEPGFISPPPTATNH